MKEKRNPGWYAAAALLLAVLTGLLLGSCGFENSCTVVMTEASAAADPVTLRIQWNGTGYGDLAFSIDGVPYSLTDFPVVSDPVYRLENESDGMAEVFLQLAYEDAEVCRLHMIPESGEELIFVCEQEEIHSFYAWVRSN